MDFMDGTVPKYVQKIATIDYVPQTLELVSIVEMASMENGVNSIVQPIVPGILADRTVNVLHVKQDIMAKTVTSNVLGSVKTRVNNCWVSVIIVCMAFLESTVRKIAQKIVLSVRQTSSARYVKQVKKVLPVKMIVLTVELKHNVDSRTAIVMKPALMDFTAETATDLALQDVKHVLVIHIFHVLLVPTVNMVIMEKNWTVIWTVETNV